MWEELPLPASGWVHESRDLLMMACGFSGDRLTFQTLVSGKWRRSLLFWPSGTSQLSEKV